jgi:hypothetical protein
MRLPGQCLLSGSSWVCAVDVPGRMSGSISSWEFALSQAQQKPSRKTFGPMSVWSPPRSMASLGSLFVPFVGGRTRPCEIALIGSPSQHVRCGAGSTGTTKTQVDWSAA